MYCFVAELERQGASVRLYYTKGPNDATDYLNGLSDQGDCVVAVGGDGTTNDSHVPIEANHSTGLRAVSLATSGRSTCAIFDNGSVGCWGNKYTVFSDNGASTANVHLVDLGAGATATMLDGVGSHTCAVIDDGSMQCWGVNTHVDQLGLLGREYVPRRGRFDCTGKFERRSFGACCGDQYRFDVRTSLR